MNSKPGFENWNGLWLTVEGVIGIEVTDSAGGEMRVTLMELQRPHRRASSRGGADGSGSVLAEPKVSQYDVYCVRSLFPSPLAPHSSAINPSS